MEGNSLVVGWLVFQFMSAPHLLSNTGTVWGSELWYWRLDICGTCSQVLLPPRTFSVGGEIREKEKGPREGNEPAKIYEKASVLDAEHMVSAQKVQAESEATPEVLLNFKTLLLLDSSRVMPLLL